MPRLEVSFFGPFQAELDGVPLTNFRSVNTQGLFAYLILQAERPFSRDLLATLFWPDVPDSTAKKNLRQTLYQLRQLLNDSDEVDEPFLLVSRQNIQWNPESDYTLDVQAFLAALAHGELATAVGHPDGYYQGELLPGFTCDSLEFEARLRQERERLHRLALSALDDLTERQITQADFAAAQATARHQLAFEPWRESAQRQLMRALALAGDRSAALAQFAICQQVLDEELGAPPERETTNLAAQIEAGAFGKDDADLIAGQYELGEQIGQGAMGTVYRGRDSVTGQPVAIKMLDRNRVAGNPELVMRFQREGEALRQLAHPNIVQLLATAEKEGHYFLIMDLVDGGDLLNYLQAQSRPPLPQVLSIALDLSDALIRAHRLDILHRDIKPANVLLDKDGRPKLTDFGIARLGQDSTLTQHGAVLGTVSYLSPEACQGEPLDERSDIWSFGLLLYEMLAGERPFARSTSAATLMAILQEPTPDIRHIRQDLPPALADLLDQMLRKDKIQRIASVRQVGAALEAILHGLDDGRAAEIILNTPLPPPVKAASPPAAPSGPFQAPNAPPHFVGRAVALAELGALLKQEQIVALVGMGGIGKTSLAAAVAQAVRAQFADGVLWANTHTSEPSNILELWGRAYDHDFSGLTDLASRETAVRSLLVDKQTLLVLDNIDDAAEARPLLVQGARSAALLTTRNLDISAALNAHAYVVPELSADSSRALLVEILGEPRVLASPDEAAAAEQIGALLHHLPLAVEIAAQRLKSRARMSLAAMAQRLQDEQQRLGLAISDSAVRASFEVSWDALDEELQDLFARIAVFGGRPFTAEALAAVADWNLYLTEDDLYTLTTLSLAQEVGETRYRQHPLLADFAAEKLGDNDVSNERMVRYFLNYAQENQENFAALDPEWENLLAAVQVAHDERIWRLVLDLTEALGTSWFRYGRYQDANTAYALAETAARKLDSNEDLAHTLLRWAEVEVDQSSYDTAWAHLETAQRIFYELEDGSGIAKADFFRGFILLDQGEYESAEEILQNSIKIHHQLNETKQEATATDQLANLYFETKEDLSEAEATAQQAMKMHQAVGNDEGVVRVLQLLSKIEIRRGDLETAVAYAHQALEVCKQLNNAVETGLVMYLLIAIYSMEEKYEQANVLADDCLSVFRRLGNLRYEAMILHEISLNHLATDNPLESERITQKTLAIFRQLEDRLNYAYNMRHLGDVYHKLGDNEKQDKAWHEAKEIATFLNHHHLLQQIEKRLSS
ncbi:MAG: protein kinase [Ardenticatenaceae bacterium]|nr:protein kinase [Ardenticatenaceae bacterium]MCB8949669.1 protein kinase [Ardenticatenaceae bacterium]